MYRIEITADTLAELAGKALSLAAKLNAGTATEEPAPVTGAVPAKIDPIMPEVAEAASSGPTPPATPTADASPASQPSGETAQPAPASEPEVTADTLRSLVLKLVAAKGRETCEEVLSRFGLAKASDVAPEQAAELAAALEDAI